MVDGEGVAVKGGGSFQKHLKTEVGKGKSSS